MGNINHKATCYLGRSYLSDYFGPHLAPTFFHPKHRVYGVNLHSCQLMGRSHVDFHPSLQETFSRYYLRWLTWVGSSGYSSRATIGHLELISRGGISDGLFGLTLRAGFMGGHFGPILWACILGGHFGLIFWVGISSEHFGQILWVGISGSHFGLILQVGILSAYPERTSRADILHKHLKWVLWAGMSGGHPT